jgi:hypothetical protein
VARDNERDRLRDNLRSIEALAERAGISIRYESLRLPRGSRDRTSQIARGGLIRVGDRRIILCEMTLPAIDKVALIAEALAAIGIDVIDLPPVLRARLHGTPLPPIPKLPKLRLKPLVKARRTG